MKRILMSVLLVVSILGMRACRVIPAVVTKLEILQKPTKLVYIIGQDSEIDLSGGIVSSTFSNSKTVESAMDQLIEDSTYVINESFDFTKIGVYVIEISKGDLKTSFEVEVQYPPYKDDNPITLGLYNFRTRGLLTETSGIIKDEVDTGVYSAFASRDEKLPSGYFQNVWTKYWESVPGSAPYKIGYQLSFTLSSGEKIDQMILSPKDTEPIFKIIEVYIYDDAHQPINVFYSHLLESQMTDKVVITTVKIHGCAGTKDIVSPLTLTAFSYNGPEDFDPVTHKYRGISSYTIIINKSN